MLERPHIKLEKWIAQNQERLNKAAEAYWQKWVDKNKRVPDKEDYKELIAEYSSTLQRQLRDDLREVIPSPYMSQSVKKIIGQIAKFMKDLKVKKKYKDEKMGFILMAVITFINGLMMFIPDLLDRNSTSAFKIVANYIQVGIMLSTLVFVAISFKSNKRYLDTIKLYLAKIMDSLSIKSAYVHVEPTYTVARINAQSNAPSVGTTPRNIPVINNEPVLTEVPRFSIPHFPMTSPAKLMHQFYYAGKTEPANARALSAPVNSTIEEKKPEVNIRDANGNVYIKMNLQGHYTRYNEEQLKEKVTTGRHNPLLARDIKSAIDNGRVNGTKTKELGITKLSKSERESGFYKTTYKLRLGGESKGIQPEVKYRPVKDEERTLSDDIQHVFTLRRILAHK